MRDAAADRSAGGGRQRSAGAPIGLVFSFLFLFFKKSNRFLSFFIFFFYVGPDVPQWSTLTLATLFFFVRTRRLFTKIEQKNKQTNKQRTPHQLGGNELSLGPTIFFSIFFLGGNIGRIVFHSLRKRRPVGRSPPEKEISKKKKKKGKRKIKWPNKSTECGINYEFFGPCEQAASEIPPHASHAFHFHPMAAPSKNSSSICKKKLQKKINKKIIKKGEHVCGFNDGRPFWDPFWTTFRTFWGKKKVRPGFPMGFTGFFFTEF